MGIGVTNNYIEDLNCGMSVNGIFQILDWTPIIPNSQIILWVNDNEDPKTW